MGTQVLASHHTPRIQALPAAICLDPYVVAVCVMAAVDAKMNVTSIVAAVRLAAENVVGSVIGVVVVVAVVMVAVRRVGGLFVRGRAFLLLMLFV